MKAKFLACICALLAAGALVSCAAESNIWNGTWKLNEAKSQMPGPAFIVTITPKGEYQITNGGYSYKFLCDGKDYPTIGYSAITCPLSSATVMDTVWKKNGKATLETHWELSPDGKTLTSTSTPIHADGSKAAKRRELIRVSASTGFAGAWKDPSALDHEPKILVTTVTNSTLRVAFPTLKQYTDIKLDGTDSPMQGTPNGVHGTLSAKQEGPLQLLTFQKLNGSVLSQSTLTLSSDDRMLIEETWRPETPTLRTRLVYEKQ